MYGVIVIANPEVVTGSYAFANGLFGFVTSGCDSTASD